jgi:hypothetical protein
MIKNEEEEKLKHVSNNLQNNITHFNDKLDEVIEVVNRPLSDANFEEAAQIFYHLIDNVPLMVQLVDPGIRIVRARINKDNELFNRKQQISYHDNAKGLQPGRFNLPDQTMFYGALPVDNPDTNQIIAAALECCKELVEEENVEESRDFTIGAWYTQKPLKLLNLCLDRDHLAINKVLRQSFDDYIAILDRNCTPQVKSFILTLTSTLSTNSKERHDTDMERIYFLLNAFRVAMNKYYNEVMKSPIDGIIYPSSMTESKGLNIVLKPSVVDDALILGKVIMQRFILKDKEYFSIPCSELLTITTDDFEFKHFHPYRK